DAVDPERVRRAERHRPGSGERTVAAVGNPRRDFVAPRERRAVDAAAGRALPFRFRRQPLGGAVLRAPPAVGLGVEPADADDRQIAGGERAFVPVARTIVSGRVDECGVLRAGHRIHRHLERIDVDAVHGTFVVLPGVAAHQERARGNRDESGGHRASVLMTRWRPYLRTNRSVNAGASALRIVRPRDTRYGYSSGRGRSMHPTIDRATSSAVCFGPIPEMRWP